MRSEKIGFYFKSPETDHNEDHFADFDWNKLPVDPELQRELDELEKADAARELGVEADDLNRHVEAREAGLPVADETMESHRSGDEPVANADTGGEPVAGDGDAQQDNENQDQDGDEGGNGQARRMENPAQYDTFAKEHYSELDTFLRSAEERKKKGGAREVDPASLRIATAVLRHVGYTSEEIEAMPERKDVVFTAKEWVFARQAGQSEIPGRTSQERRELVNDIKTLTMDRLMTGEDRQGLRERIKDQTGWSDTQVERVVNMGILVPDSIKSGLQLRFNEVIKSSGGLLEGDVRGVVAQGARNVGEFLAAEGRGEVVVSRLVAFVRTAGVEVREDTTWEDLIDKRNIVLLQMLVGQGAARGVVMVMTPTERNVKVQEMMQGVAQAMYKTENGQMVSMDPTREEVRAKAKAFMDGFAPGSKRGEDFLVEYMNNYREYLKVRFNLKFDNEMVDRRLLVNINSKEDVEKYLLREFDEIERDPREVAMYQVGPMQMQGFINIVDTARRQNLITETEARELKQVREAAKILKNLKEEMYSAPNVTDNFNSISRMMNELETSGRLLALVGMRVKTVTAEGKVRGLLIGNEPVTMAHVVAEWDRRARRGQTADTFYDVFSESEIAEVARVFGGNVQAVRMARDLYFVTGGAARYEVSLARDATGRLKKQTKGIGLRDVFNPVDIRYATSGSGANFREDRKMLARGLGGEAPGIDLMTASFWEHDNPLDEQRPRGQKPLEMVALHRQNPNAETYHDYPPLTAQRVVMRVQATGAGKTMVGWLKRVKGAEGAIKAEEEYLTADEKDGLEKFKALHAAYVYLGPKDQAVAFTNRAKLRIEYYVRRGNTPESGLLANRRDIETKFLEIVRSKLSGATDNERNYYREVLAFYEARKRRIPSKKRVQQLSPEVRARVKTAEKIGMLEALRESLIKILF